MLVKDTWGSERDYTQLSTVVRSVSVPWGHCRGRHCLERGQPETDPTDGALSTVSDGVLVPCHRRASCFGVFRTPDETPLDEVGSVTMAVSANPRLDEAFDILGNVHRRRLLYNLRDGRVERLGGATRVVADGGVNDHTQLEVELYHLHLPKLDSAGYVSWDRESGAIDAGPQFEEIAPLLELMEDHADKLPDASV